MPEVAEKLGDLAVVVISDEMCAEVLSFVYDSGRLQLGWTPSDSVGAEGSDREWVADLIRVVLASASKELKKLRSCHVIAASSSTNKRVRL